MTSRLSSEEYPRTRHFSFDDSLLWALLLLSLVYYVVLLIDLILHPTARAVGVDGGVDAASRYIFLLMSAGVIVIGAFITHRTHGNRIGLLLILWAVGGIASNATRATFESPTQMFVMLLIMQIFNGIAWPALFIMVCSFPTGHIYPPRAVGVVRIGAVLSALSVILPLFAQRPGAPGGLSTSSLPINPLFIEPLANYSPFINVGIGVYYVLGNSLVVVSLVLRYRASTSRERQQIKWFVWVAGISTSVFTLALISSGLFPSLVSLEIVYVFYALFCATPAVGIGIAILRHRLWDIDTIINKTLVYAALTGLLAALYAALIVTLQYVSGVIAGPGAQHPIALVVSTLVIAALFQPLRHRVQAIIDRRFYVRKYDAEKTLAAFSATLRNEVDLDQLHERLLDVVQETMQLAHVSLWLRQPSEERAVSVWRYGPRRELT